MIYNFRQSFHFGETNEDLIANMHESCESEEALLAFDVCEQVIYSAKDQVSDNDVLEYMEAELRNLDGYYDGDDFYVDCVVTDNVIGNLFNEALEIYNAGEAVYYDDLVQKYIDDVREVL